MGKGINDSAMGKLLEGLTSVNKPIDTPSQETSMSPSLIRKGTPATVRETSLKEAKKERVCTSLDKILIDKIRTIAEKEGIQINELISCGLDMVVSKYEETHGKLHPRKEIRGDIKKLFR